jgi:hypothetical protein
MTLSLGGVVLVLFGLVDLAAWMWAYFGPVSESGAPRGFGNIDRTWHGRGSVCAALPAGVFFLCLGLGSLVDGDALRTLLFYIAVASLAAAVLFLFRAPQWARPAWMRQPSRV